MTRRIGLLTGGGDCPGLNAAIRAVVRSAVNQHGLEVVGFLDGFRGFVDNQSLPLTHDAVSGIVSRGGTILGTTNRDNLFAIAHGKSQRVPAGADRTDDALDVIRKHGLEGLVVIGGDGTFVIGQHLMARGVPIVGIPKTIDNDVTQTERTIGFDTAVGVATEAIDRLHTTAASHHRVMVVEVMGRDAGWIALYSGIASGADLILIPEIPFAMEAVGALVTRRSQKGSRFSIIVLAEGAGEGMDLAKEIERRTGLETRATVLGHLLRGGTPTSFDRFLATRFGYTAAGLAAKREYGVMVGWRSGSVTTVPLKELGDRPRTVPPDSPIVATARAMGASFGDGGSPEAPGPRTAGR